jgi:hypothetical protein
MAAEIKDNLLSIFVTTLLIALIELMQGKSQGKNVKFLFRHKKDAVGTFKM